jgi:hypothetical protein
MKSKTPTKQVVYIGDQFYSQSGSAMSSVYEVRTVNGKKEYKRYDYGFLLCDLAKGIRVNMRPATDKELGMFHKVLIKVQAEMDAVRSGV